MEKHKCRLCKEKEATNFNGDFGICNACLVDIQLAFSYHIGGKEVTREEYDRNIERNPI